MAGGGDGEQTAVAQVVDQVADRASQCDVFGLVADRDEGVGQRDTGLDEHGELTREVHQLLLLHLLLGELEVEHAPRLFDLRREQILFHQQRASGADGLGLGDPFDGRTRRIDCCVSELGHFGGSCTRGEERWGAVCSSAAEPTNVRNSCQWANRVRTTSGTVVTSSSTSCIASRSMVRMPCATARRRSSSVVAQPTMRRRISGVILSSS